MESSGGRARCSLVRFGVLALLLASGCSLAPSLQMRNASSQHRETMYAVVGTFAVMSVLAALLAGSPGDEAEMPRPEGAPLPGR